MTLTTRLAALALAFTSALSLTAAPADACGDYGSFRLPLRTATAKPEAKKAPERIKGTVIAFRGLPAVTLGADARVTIQYPTFQNTGTTLYMTDVHVPASQLRPLHRALAAALARNERARAGVELEQVGADEWRLVSWKM